MSSSLVLGAEQHPLPSEQEVAHLHRINVARQDPPTWCPPLRPRDGLPLPGCFVEVDWEMYESEVQVIKPVPPVGYDTRLSAAARGHARYLSHNNLLGHGQQPGRPHFTGQTPFHRVRAAGWNGHRVMENVGGPALDHEGLLTAFIVDWQHPNKPVRGGMQDPRGHRDTLFSPAFGAMGLSVWQGAETKVPDLWVVHEFATITEPRWLSVLAWEDGDANGLYDPGEGLKGCRLTVSNGDGQVILDQPLWQTGLLSLPLNDDGPLEAVLVVSRDGKPVQIARFAAPAGESALWWEAKQYPKERIQAVEALLTRGAKISANNIPFCTELVLASWGMDTQHGVGAEVEAELGKRTPARSKVSTALSQLDSLSTEGQWQRRFPSPFNGRTRNAAVDEFTQQARDIADAAKIIEPVLQAAIKRRALSVKRIAAAKKANKRLLNMEIHPALRPHAHRLTDLMTLIRN